MLLRASATASPPSVRELQDWRELAACRGEDPELFFPVGTAGPAAVQAQQAKEVCHRCPVARECLEFALRVGLDHGIWGGMTAEERRDLRRGVPPCRTP